MRLADRLSCSKQCKFLRPFRERLRWRLPGHVVAHEVIQRAVDALGGRTYLEIGVRWGCTFCKINCPRKIGVDPAPPADCVREEVEKGRARYFQLTSDEFFAALPYEQDIQQLDVVFIDGLHTYEQALRDCENALKLLTPRGIILVHDCSPLSEIRALRAQSYEEAEAAGLPGWDGCWNGDVWKAIVHLRATRADLRLSVLNCDHGIGVVTRSEGELRLPLSVDEIRRMSYGDFAANRTRLLNLQPPSSLAKVLARQPRRSAKAIRL